MKRWTIRVLPAGRKWDRMFSEAVARSVAKTVTEPITNSWDSYKMAERLDASSGIVEALLKLNEGDSVDHDALMKSAPRRPSVPIRVLIATSKTGSGFRKRECRVVDQATGMDADELRRCLELYGEEKSGQADGKPVRGLFGQGLSDVLFGHDDGRVISLKEGVLREVKVYRDDSRQPNADLVTQRKATQKDRHDWGITSDGTCVTVLLTRSCHVPDPESLYERLCSFYMLRLINADPACRVVLEQYRTGGKVLRQTLGYNLPPGKVIGKFSTSYQFEDYPPIRVDAIAVHASEPLRQGVGPGKEDREGGFLVVDETDTVYDLTCFDFEKTPGLDHLYGVVRLSGAREVIRDLLDRRESKTAVVTDSRDGFDLRSDFGRGLWRAVYPQLKPIIEAEARLATEEVRVSEETDRRVKRAFQELNELFKSETAADGGIGPEEAEVHVSGLAFAPPGPLVLRAGIPRHVQLLAESEAFGGQTEIILDASNAEISVRPERLIMSDARRHKGRRTFPLQIIGGSIGVKGTIAALAEKRDGDLATCELAISGVLPPPVLVAPEEGMEFRPGIASAAPYRKGAIFLFLDVERIPLGSEVHVRMDASPSGLSLLTSDETPVRALSPIGLSADHLVDGKSIARIALRFRGQAKGQQGDVLAKTKGSGRHSYKASALLMVKDPEPEESGIFSKPDYRPLAQRVVSAFDEGSGIIYLNSNHPLNQAFFGDDRVSFWKAVQDSETAQLWLAEAALTEALYHILATKCLSTGERGFKLKEHDPIGSIREQIEEWRYTKGAGVFRALAPGLPIPPSR